MRRVSGLMLTFSLLPFAAQAAANGIPQKQTAFRAAKIKLESDINLFLQQVESCNPPTFLGKDMKKKILDGFGDITNSQSAKSLLNLHEELVNKHVATADAKFSAAKAVGGSCEDKTMLFNAAGKAAQESLDVELKDFRRGIDEANKQKSSISIALSARKFMGALASGKGNLEACDAATKQLEVMDASNKRIQASLADLNQSYSERIVFERDGACRSASIASSESQSDEESHQASELGTSGSAL